MQRHYWMAAAILTSIGASLVAGLAHNATESAAIAAAGPDSVAAAAPVEPARFASLRFDEVNGRRGPSLDQPILWTYRRTGLPFHVLERAPDWWRVEDPDGARVWIAARMFEPDTRTVLVEGIAGEAVALRDRPADGAETLALAEPGVILALDSCVAGWCRVVGGRASGWLPAAALWGVGEAETR